MNKSNIRLACVGFERASDYLPNFHTHVKVQVAFMYIGFAGTRRQKIYHIWGQIRVRFMLLLSVLLVTEGYQLAVLLIFTSILHPIRQLKLWCKYSVTEEHTTLGMEHVMLWCICRLSWSNVNHSCKERWCVAWTAQQTHISAALTLVLLAHMFFTLFANHISCSYNSSEFQTA